MNERLQAAILRVSIQSLNVEYEDLQRQQQELLVTTQSAGRLALLNSELSGRFVAKGEVIAHVLQPSPPTVRVIVTQQQLNHIQQDLKGIEVRLVGDPSLTHSGEIAQMIPSATSFVPSISKGTRNSNTPAIDGSRNFAAAGIT